MSVDFLSKRDNFSWKQVLILWMHQPSKRLCKARIMTTFDPKQGNSRSCTWIKMLSEWWVSCWDCHLKLPLWCEFWCQVANEFRWNFLRVSTNILYCYFFRSLSSRLVTADDERCDSVAVESSSFCGGHAGGRGNGMHEKSFVPTVDRSSSSSEKTWPGEAQTTGRTSFCWVRVMPTIKRRSFFSELQFLLEVWWLKDQVWGLVVDPFDWMGRSSSIGTVRHFLYTLDRKWTMYTPSNNAF